MSESMHTAGSPKTGATLNRGRSNQAWGTPWEFIRACVHRFGPISHDLAAGVDNRKANEFFGEMDNSLVQDWTRLDGNLWLNPPFANIGTWAEKCAVTSARRRGFILFLTPASIGTEWFEAYVHHRAVVLALSPRLTFEGADDPYPKDLMLSVYGYGLSGFNTWRWK